jgi:RNA polymerase sigma-70 factor (ECF subfamily)
MGLDDFTDADNVRDALAGDREAFGRLFDRYARLVRAVAAAVAQDFDAVDDLTQETFLRAFRSIGSLKDPAKFGIWIQGIARLTAREGRRRLARMHRGGAEELSLVGDSSSVALERDEQQRRVLAAVGELPECERLVVHAYFFHQQKADDAAAALGLSRSGYYAALNRGLDRLRKKLKQDDATSATARAER